jgi:RNA polymerase sigma-70 factor (ECF subfamily)
MLVPEDDVIIAMIATPDQKNQGYRHLVSKYKEKLYWHIRRMVHSHEDADDVLQNTFLKIFRNMDSFHQHSSLYTWMFRIATNESLNFMKSTKYHQTESLDHMAYFKATSEIMQDESVILNMLQRAINSLPEKQKLVFNLRYYSEMSYQQISEITDTSVGALKASYHHAVKKIEEIVKSQA